MKKALIVGIDVYPTAPLNGCVNDAKEITTVLEKNDDGSSNFDVRLIPNIEAKGRLMVLIRELFSGSGDTALFYFSGHGCVSGDFGYIVTPDAMEGTEGVSMCEIMKLANESKFKNRIIILDCCFSGQLCKTESSNIGAPHIARGVTILSACNHDEAAVERGGHGLFTALMLDALKGGAASVDGEVSPSGVYSYVDRSLGAWEPRPLFATNVSERVVLRKAKPEVRPDTLRNVCKYFETADSTHKLDPSYEDTNSPTINREAIKPYADKGNVAIFKELQEMARAGLVVPVDAAFMYFAAMESKSCALTARGRHYWHLAKTNKI